MENRLEGVGEEVEKLDDMSPSGLRVVATLAVILVTAATVSATALAATASNSAAVAQRSRQVYQARATTAGLEATQQATAAAAQRDDATEATWRSLLLTQASQDATDPTVSKALRAEAANLTQTGGPVPELHRLEPATAETYPVYSSILTLPSVRDDQYAQAYATQSSAWYAKEDGYLATISMFAVALFLLGLALTLLSRRSASSFVILALALLAVGVVRIGASVLTPVAPPSTAAITAYMQATRAADNLASATLTPARYRSLIASAERTFRRAVTTLPTYATAWLAFGSLTADLAATPAQYRPAVAQYRAAITYGHAFPTLYNDLGNAQMMAQEPGAAATLRRGLALDPSNPITLGTLAETRVAAGDLSGALAYLHRALGDVARHGPQYQVMYFDSLRSDEPLLMTFAPRTVVEKFWTAVKDAEVRLSTAGTIAPGTAHGATVTGITVSPLEGVAGQHGGVTVGFDYTGLRSGDTVSVRWYQDGAYFEAPPSTTMDVPSPSLQPGSGTVAPYSGINPLLIPNVSQTVEIYVNGVLVATAASTPGGTPVN